MAVIKRKLGSAFSSAERQLLARLKTPDQIQSFIDTIPYSTESVYRAPLAVIRERCGHCFDGAVLAAMCLRNIGHPPLILELLPNRRDDDHIIALFRVSGYWGAVAKSNFVGLRYREPIFKGLRELVLSYFENYFNSAGEKTLRGYTGALNLAAFDRYSWTTENRTMELIGQRLDQTRRYNLLSPAMARRLSPVDPLTLKAGLLGANPQGLFKV